ncbi:L-ascorbate metabolism protein UlaG (beta-lactamase superfamily) [Variibacter gotjawalensis]|nr:L-ascorbate metabolism protein UlaG (beta-lactamase superfamily) [Variibacter gotjawalensis]
MTGWSALARYYDGPVSDHFDGTQFFDQYGTPPKALSSVLKWMIESKLPGNSVAVWPTNVANGTFAPPPPRVDGDALRVTAIGHASMLIQTAGLNILIDPVWSQRASPFTFAGPKRARAPGIAFDALPKIDIVLVTHNHYDHLDIATLKLLADKHNPRVVTPLGNDTIMRADVPAIRAEAYDWGDRVDLGNGVSAALHPSRHWSARGIGDRNKALWAAFALKTPGGSIYHVGDSGYGDGHHFRTAREKYGPFRLAILPVGAYEPRWFMKDQHMNPDDAVKTLADLGAPRAIGHHFGTFQLTDEAIDAPRMALTAACKAASISENDFRMLLPGEGWEL